MKQLTIKIHLSDKQLALLKAGYSLERALNQIKNNPDIDLLKSLASQLRAEENDSTQKSKDADSS